MAPASQAHAQEVFRRFDYNGNGLLSLAEIDKAVIEMYPEYAKNKPAIMRAYKACDVSQVAFLCQTKDGFITFDEFSQLLRLIDRFNELFKLFSKLDVDKDRRISLNEFKKGHSLLGLDKSAEQLKKTFDLIDTNKGGMILFDEVPHQSLIPVLPVYGQAIDVMDN